MTFFKQRSSKHKDKAKKSFRVPFDIYEKHIGVVGLGSAGKTVFLTSFIDQLQLNGFKHNHNVTTLPFRAVTSKQKGNRAFRHRRYRELIAEHCIWPDKSGMPESYSCFFKRSDWSMPLRLHFHDIPGERIADASMYRNTYDKWSKYVLDALTDKYVIGEAVRRYEDLCVSDTADEQQIVHAYKLLLSKLVMDFRADITPSTFILSPQGKVIEGDTGGDLTAHDKQAEAWAATQCIGLSAEQEFAPLPQAAMSTKQGIYKQFRENYRSYERGIVRPVFDRLARCHQLLILVDVPGMLCSNDRQFNDATRLVEELLKACKPKYPTIVKTINKVAPHRFRPARLTRVAIVGPKTDLVAKCDVSTRMRALLEGMTGHLLANIETVGYSYIPCSAVISTADVPEQPYKRRGYLVYNADGTVRPTPINGGRPRTYSISPLPEKWPSRWKVGDFSFPEVWPIMPANHSEPPECEGLFPVLQFICGGGCDE